WWPACGPPESPEPHPPGASSGGCHRVDAWVAESGDGAPLSGGAPMRIMPVTTTGHDIRCHSKKPVHSSPPSGVVGAERIRATSETPSRRHWAEITPATV